jgi:tripartite-type tricarboxylate transporter receptor subunit TctC
MLLCGLWPAGPATAQTAEAFYKGQTIRIIVGSPPGGSYDLYARALARHFGRHIPGQPSVVVQNMPGGGGYAAANHIYNQAPRDGTAIATFSRSVPMQPLIDPTGVHFDPRKLVWIGSPSDEVGVALSWHESPVKTVDDLRKRGMTVAATGPGTDSNVYARVIANLLGLNLKLVTGYTGAADMLLAVQRGEAEGIGGVSWSSLWPAQKDLVEGHKVNILMQLGLRPGTAPDLKGVPLVVDLVQGAAEREALQIIFARQSMAYPYAVPPDVPPDRLKALRDAFAATLADPQYIAEAKTAGMSVNYVSWQEMDRLMAQVYGSSPETVVRVKAAME